MKLTNCIFYSAVLFSNYSISYYQDIFVNGQIIEHGERSCAATWQLLSPFLNNYKHPIKVLDLGAAQGFFSFNIASKYDSTCIMMEASYDYTGHVEKLLELCRQNNLPNMIFINDKVTAEKLNLLGKTEHFDIVLALNFLHHAGGDYKELLDKACNLADHIIVENPPAEETETASAEYIKRKYIETTLLARGGIILGYVPRHTTSKYMSKVILLACTPKKEPTNNYSKDIKPIIYQQFNVIYPNTPISNN